MDIGELLQKIHQIEIKSRRLSRNAIAGHCHSDLKGRGMAFHEVRKYVAGDDIRNIDWNVTARYSKFFVKVFNEDRELTVLLLMDVSGSQEFGTQGMIKKNMAIEIAATLAFSCMQNSDKIGVIFFSNKIEGFIPPRKGRKHMLYIVSELINFHPTHKGTDITQVLQYIINVVKKRCKAFLISDFISSISYQHSLSIANKKHDIVAIQIFDRRETEMPNVGWIKIYDAEGEKEQWIDTASPKVRIFYKQWWNSRQFKMESEFKKSRVDFVSISTDENYVKTLLNFFTNRLR